MYSKFIKYARDVSSGNRVTSLENILEFVTGASEEPPLGFERTPCIQFVIAELKVSKITTVKAITSLFLLRACIYGGMPASLPNLFMFYCIWKELEICYTVWHDHSGMKVLV